MQVYDYSLLKDGVNEWPFSRDSLGFVLREINNKESRYKYNFLWSPILVLF